MKKSIGLVLVAALCVSGAFAMEGSNLRALSEEGATNKFRLGKDAILEIRKGYQEGRYSAFLKEMDASYEEVLEAGQLLSLASLRQGTALDLQWMDAVKILQKERNEQLLQIVSGQDSLFAEKVRSIAISDASPSLFLTIHQMAPGTGKNQDENALIAIDLEYEYKAIHLDMPRVGKDAATDSRENYCALKMEQMDKMLLAAQSFTDEALQSEVLLFAQNLDVHLAKNWDQMDLRSFLFGNVKPTDKIEEKVASILKEHHEKMSELSMARN